MWGVDVKFADILTLRYLWIFLFFGLHWVTLAFMLFVQFARSVTLKRRIGETVGGCRGGGGRNLPRGRHVRSKWRVVADLPGADARQDLLPHDHLLLLPVHFDPAGMKVVWELCPKEQLEYYIPSWPNLNMISPPGPT